MSSSNVGSNYYNNQFMVVAPHLIHSCILNKKSNLNMLVKLIN